MFTLTHRTVVAVLLACAAPGAPAARAAEEKPLSPETIVAKDFEGKATIEFAVGEVHLQPASWAASSDGGWKVVPLLVEPKADAAKGRVTVLVSGETAVRLKQLGIESPAEHLSGKVLRVSGTVERIPTRSGPRYRLQVNGLDQLEAIRKP
jgi:hypothetical protein